MKEPKTNQPNQLQTKDIIMTIKLFLTNHKKDEPIEGDFFENRNMLSTGRPFATRHCTVEQLEEWGSIGVYENITYEELPKGTYKIENLWGEVVVAEWDGNLWQLEKGYLHPQDVKVAARYTDDYKHLFWY